MRCGDQYSNTTIQERGIKQGCSLSPILFIIYLDTLFDKLDEEFALPLKFDPQHSIIAPPPRPLELGYADDLAFASTNIKLLEKTAGVVDDHLHALGLQLNEKKSNLLLITPPHAKPSYTTGEHCSITSQRGSTLTYKFVESYKYLGINLKNNLMCTIGQNNILAPIFSFGTTLMDPAVPQHLKIKVFNTYVSPRITRNNAIVGLYSTWKPNNKTIKDLLKKTTKFVTNMLQSHTTIRLPTQRTTTRNVLRLWGVANPQDQMENEAAFAVLRMTTKHPLDLNPWLSRHLYGPKSDDDISSKWSTPILMVVKKIHSTLRNFHLHTFPQNPHSTTPTTEDYGKKTTTYDLSGSINDNMKSIIKRWKIDQLNVAQGNTLRYISTQKPLLNQVENLVGDTRSSKYKDIDWMMKCMKYSCYTAEIHDENTQKKCALHTHYYNAHLSTPTLRQIAGATLGMSPQINILQAIRTRSFTNRILVRRENMQEEEEEGPTSHLQHPQCEECGDSETLHHLLIGCPSKRDRLKAALLRASIFLKTNKLGLEEQAATITKTLQECDVLRTQLLPSPEDGMEVHVICRGNLKSPMHLEMLIAAACGRNLCYDRMLEMKRKNKDLYEAQLAQAKRNIPAQSKMLLEEDFMEYYRLLKYSVDNAIIATLHNNNLDQMANNLNSMIKNEDDLYRYMVYPTGEKSKQLTLIVITLFLLEEMIDPLCANEQNKTPPSEDAEKNSTLSAEERLGEDDD